MSTASNARASQIARDVEKGKYVKQFKFANYGSVVEDSLKAQQAQADARLLEIQAGKLKKVTSFPSDRPEMRDSKTARVMSSGFRHTQFNIK